MEQIIRELTEIDFKDNSSTNLTTHGFIKGGGVYEQNANSFSGAITLNDNFWDGHFTLHINGILLDKTLAVEDAKIEYLKQVKKILIGYSDKLKIK